jgi:hypothetical protein
MPDYVQVMNAVNMWIPLINMLLLILIIVLMYHPEYLSRKKSSFVNFNDTQYNNRFQAGPDGQSLNDRMLKAQEAGMAAWQATQNKPSNVSGLTGSRDVPVFFQDYDIDMQNKGGNIYNQREGFNDPEKDCGIPGAC